MKRIASLWRLPATLAMILVLSFWAVMFIQLRQPILSGMTDFSVFYCSGNMVASGHGSDIYSHEAQRVAQLPFAAPGTIVLPYVFPPYVLVLFVPLSLLSYKVAVAVWYALNGVLLLSALWLMGHKFEFTNGQFALSMITLAMFYPATECLSIGQVSIITLLLFTLAFLDLDSGRDFRSGCFLALALYKPQFVIVPFLALLVVKNWAAVKGFILTSAGLLGASVLISGWRAVVAFPSAIKAFHGVSGTEHPGRMPNLRGLLTVAFPSLSETELLALVVVASVIIMASVMYLSPWRKKIGALEFSVVILLSLLVSYHAGKHDLVLLVLPLLIAARHIARIDSPNLAAILALITGVVFLSPAMLPGPAIAAILATVLTAVPLLTGLSVLRLVSGTDVPKHIGSSAG